MSFFTRSNSYTPQDEEGEIISGKIILIGDSTVGKTSILYRFLKDKFFLDPSITLGVEMSSKKMRINSNKYIILNIWDSAGQERYKSLTYHFYTGIIGAILVFDLTQEKTLMSIKEWKIQIEKHAPPNILLVLVGNKDDEASSLMNKSTIDTEIYNLGIKYFECSAKTGKNIQHMFNYVAEGIFEKIKKKREEEDRDENPRSNSMIIKYQKKEGTPDPNKIPNCCF